MCKCIESSGAVAPPDCRLVPLFPREEAGYQQEGRSMNAESGTTIARDGNRRRTQKGTESEGRDRHTDLGSSEALDGSTEEDDQTGMEVV